MAEQTSPPGGPPQMPRTPAGTVTAIVTNLGKLAGVVFGTLEAIGPARPPAVLFWVALFLGAQAVEDIVTKFIDRAMGK
jgi:hypothetical protein